MNPIDELKAKADALGESLQKIGEAMYKQQAADANAQPGAGTTEEPKTQEATSEGTDAKDEAVEGEVVEEKKEE
jgi:hypothetical protein